MKKHELKIVSLNDAQLSCSCGWNYSLTGAMTPDEAKRKFKEHIEMKRIANNLRTFSEKSK